MPILQITTSVGCKIYCPYCPQDKFVSAYRKISSNFLMSLDDFKVCIDKLPTEVGIRFAGMCEPWQNPDCTQMILYAHKQGHIVSVMTTLTGLPLSDLELLDAVSFGLFQVHLPSDSLEEKIPITDQYLRVLNKLSKSNINATYHCHGKNPNPRVKPILDNNNKTIEYRSLYERSGNIKIQGRLDKTRKRGVIECERQLKNNVLLPNGNVLLCSNDFGIKHILGNLISSSYDSLFSGSEFAKVVNGQQDESFDIICRYCDNFSTDSNISAYMYNFYYRLDRYIYYLKGVGSFKDLETIVSKVLRKFGKISK